MVSFYKEGAAALKLYERIYYILKQIIKIGIQIQVEVERKITRNGRPTNLF